MPPSITKNSKLMIYSDIVRKSTYPFFVISACNVASVGFCCWYILVTTSKHSRKKCAIQCILIFRRATDSFWGVAEIWRRKTSSSWTGKYKAIQFYGKCWFDLTNQIKFLVVKYIGIDLWVLPILFEIYFCSFQSFFKCFSVKHIDCVLWTC